MLCFSSSLSIVPVKEEHNGQWNCLLVSINGNKSKAVSVIVISEHTRYCPLAGIYLSCLVKFVSQKDCTLI